VTTLLPYIILGLVSGSVYGLAALGLVLTYRTSGIFNFAHGSIAALGAFLFYQLRQLNGLPWPIALFLAVVVAGPLAGLVLERMARTLTNASITARVVATLGVLVALQQVAVIRYGTATREFQPFLPTGTHDLFGARVGTDQIIVLVVAALGTVALSLLLRSTRLGLSMRGVVDNDSLTALTGTSPVAVRRYAWGIGCGFAALSGILIAPTIGLDSAILTLLVVQAFGAAAFGLFTSLPLAYAGGLVLGVVGAISSKYIGENAGLHAFSGFPSSLPFILLFGVLLLAPKRRLLDIAPERRGPVRRRKPLPRSTRLAMAGVATLLLLVVPNLVGSRLTGWTSGLAFAIIFLSLVLLERLSGQLSLAQLSFAAVGGASFSHFVGGLGMPWLVAVFLAALIAVPVGALLAIPAIRLSGLYLALATFGFGLLMQALVYNQKFMFGIQAVITPRPGWADGDKAYYYVVLAFALAAAGLLIAVRSSPLGRLLRAMADSPTALTTGGMNVTAIKVVAFCLSSFLAGLAGALLGPVTGSLSASSLDTFASLTLVVILALQAPFGDVPAAFLAAFVAAVLPSYLNSHEHLLLYLPLVFGVSAVGAALVSSASGEGGSGASPAHEPRGSRSARSPVRARFEAEAVR
jgi:branched-subunit amino acid ABC-type transport system permease component